MAYRIMIVEDEFWTAMDLAHEIRKQGATVVGPFGSVAQVMDELSGPQGPDAAILDVRLHNGDIFTVADILMRKGIPFVFATAHDPQDIPMRFAGIPHFEKPFACRPCVEKALALARGCLARG